MYCEAVFLWGEKSMVGSLDCVSAQDDVPRLQWPLCTEVYPAILETVWLCIVITNETFCCFSTAGRDIPETKITKDKYVSG